MNKDRIDKLMEYTEEQVIKRVLDDHPDLQILWERRPFIEGPIEINGVNPILHILLESIVENQILLNNPPEVKDALVRLMDKGMSHHVARMTIASVLANFMFKVFKEDAPFDVKGYVDYINVLGRSLEKVGRNEPCPCGSGKKYKRCCLNKLENVKRIIGDLNTKAIDGRIILGGGKYASIEYLRTVSSNDPLLLLENRAHIADFLEEMDDVEGALMVLKENAATAENLNDEGFIRNAYLDLLFFYQNHADKFAEDGLKLIDKILPLSKERDEIGTLRCDRADFLGRLGRIEEAQKEFESIFEDMPDWYFGRYRYALFLEDIGQRDKAIEVLKYLLSIKDKLDYATYTDVSIALKSMGEDV